MTDTKTRTKTTTRRVLGASTELPATGGSTAMIVLAAILFVCGLALTIFGKRKARNMKALLPLIIACAAFGLSGLPAHAEVVNDSTLALKIEQPITPIFTTDFLVGFVSLGIDKSTVTVKCYREGVAEPFETYTNLHNEGGLSGNCHAASSGITADGTYAFYVTAEAGSGVNESDHVSVRVDLSTPETPTDYVRTDADSCNKHISFLTGNDGGETASVELYRSTNVSFVADDSTRVHTLVIGSNTPGSFDDVIAPADCGATYYYAIRALDSEGNASGYTGDKNVTVTQETRTRHRTRTVVVPANGAGTVTLNPGTGNTGSGAGTGVGNATPDTGTGQNGEVQGAQTPDQGAVQGAETTQSSWSRIFLDVIALGAAAYLFYRLYISRRHRHPDVKE